MINHWEGASDGRSKQVGTHPRFQCGSGGRPLLDFYFMNLLRDMGFCLLRSNNNLTLSSGNGLCFGLSDQVLALWQCAP